MYKTLRTPVYPSRPVNGRIQEKLECVGLSMCMCYVDMFDRECVVRECERVNGKLDPTTVPRSTHHLDPMIGEVLQCVAVRCRVLQCVAVCCSVGRRIIWIP